MTPHRSWGRVRAIAWAAQILIAVIFAQTLYFKFTYSPETQAIFAGRGGRPAATLVGLFELACVLMLLITRTAAVGALLSLFAIGGAIFTHLTSLGVEVEGDGGLLFGLALAVAGLSAVVLACRWRELPFLGPRRPEGGACETPLS